MNPAHPPAAPAPSARLRSRPSRALPLAPALLLGLAAGCGSTGGGANALVPPAARTVDVVDVFHGVEVADPYRWLEGDVRTDRAVEAWVRAQDAVARRHLAAIEAREPIRRRLEALWDHPRRSAPERRGEHWYAWVNDGLEAQSRLVRGPSPEAALGLEPGAETVLDPNGFSADGTVAYAGGAFSDDGRYLAYGTSASGSDWSEWRVLDLERLEQVGGTLSGIKWGGVTWTADGAGFFYSRFELPQDGVYLARTTENRVWYHAVGTEQDADLLIHERPDHPEWTFWPRVSDDGRWLVLHVSEAGTNVLVHVFDLEEATAEPIELVDRFTADFAYVGTAPTGELILRTDQDAPNGRVLAVDPRLDPPRWTELVPEREWRLESVDEVGGQLVAVYLADASSKVVRYGLATQADDGRGEGAERAAAAVELGEVELPAIGTASGFEGESGDEDVYFTLSSFARPSEVHRLDLGSGRTELVAPGTLAVDPERFTVSQVWYESKDGTRVPMFLAHRADLRPAAEGPGEHPTLLYGYGGFDVSLTPSFSVTRLVWMELGGVFAMPNLRGGGEFGEAWHRAGTRTNKQNVFDDFVAAAEWLVDSGWTRPERLAIQGGSNGGLLVAACLTQRPDLFGACLPAVGVLDMLRYHLFTAGRFWVDDYGSVEDPDEFAALLSYSPYHNLVPGTAYPPTLITTADTDDRVVPAHSFKFAARLQAAQGGDAPILLRVERSAGHGAGKPTAKRIEEAADSLAFCVEQLGFEPDLDLEPPPAHQARSAGPGEADGTDAGTGAGPVAAAAASGARRP